MPRGMTSQTPPHPDWLKAELDLLARDMPQTKVIALFADDLPHSHIFFTPIEDRCELAVLFNDRAKALREMILDQVDYPKFTDGEIRGMSNIYNGFAHYSGESRIWHMLDEPDFLLQGAFLPFSHATAPDYAVIGLPARNMPLSQLLARSFTADEKSVQTSVTMDDFCRGIFYHEAEHVRQTGRLHRALTNRQSEREADYAAITRLKAAGLHEAAEQEITARLVWNFLNGVDLSHEREGRHWNRLDLGRDGQNPDTEKLEAASQLEVAFRAIAEQTLYADLPRLPATPTALLQDVLRRYQSYTLVLHGLKPDHLHTPANSRKLALGLAQSVQRDEFSLPASRELAQRTLTALEALAPGLLEIPTTEMKRHFRPL